MLLQRLAVIIKPNTILTLYTVCSPFFKMETLNNLPSIFAKMHGTASQSNNQYHRFLNINLFDIDYYLFKIDNNNSFKYINDSPILSFNVVYGEYENMAIQDLINYLVQLQVITFLFNL